MQLGRPEPPSAQTQIDLAERAAHLSVGQWSLALLRAGYPQGTDEAFLALPVGARDRYVMALRRLMIGGPMRAEPRCAACDTVFELTLDPADLGLGPSAPDVGAGAQMINLGGQARALRPVTLGDMLAIENIADADQAAQVLGRRVLGDDAEDVALDDLAQALEDLDPGADIWLATRCPDCTAEAQIAFDPVAFVATELRQKANQILRDVVDIARVFHWSERDILALPAARRAFYVAEALG